MSILPTTLISANSFLPSVNDRSPENKAPSEQEIENYLDFERVSVEGELADCQKRSDWHTYDSAFISKAQEYVAIAERQSTPEAQAFYFCKAKKFVQEIIRHTFSKTDQWRFFEELTFKEAQACEKAAANKSTSKEARQWLLRGAKTLYDPDSSPFDTFHQYHTIEELKNLEKASVLWSRVGNDLFTLDPTADCHHLKNEFRLIKKNELLLSSTEASAACYTNAANALSFANVLYKREGKDGSSSSEKAFNLSKKAIFTLQSRLPTIENSSIIARFSEKIAELQQYQLHLLNLSDDCAKTEKKKEVFQSRLNVASKFEKLAELETSSAAIYLTKQAINLREAAFLSQTLEKKVELFRQAKEITEKIWQNYPDDRWCTPGFSPDGRYRSCCWESTLDGELTSLLNEAEKKLQNSQVIRY